ncbi:hypothetical protein ACOMHN_020193 [Nucella lapillus]
MSLASLNTLFLFSFAFAVAAGKQDFTRMFGNVLPPGEHTVGSLLFETKVSSVIQCAVVCKGTPSCQFLTVGGLSSAPVSPVVCRGHAGLPAGSNGTVLSDPAHTVWALQESDWLEKECGKDWECGESHRECYKGSCLCTPGYYYSLSRDSCVPTCPVEELQPRLLAYPGRFISGNNLKKCYKSLTLEDCLARCRATPKARTCDGWKSYCCLQTVTWLDVEEGVRRENTPRIHHQKACF